MRVSGYSDESIIAAFRSLLETRAFAEGESFGLSHAEKMPNPDANNVVRHVKRFNAKWGEDLEQLLKTDERWSRLNSLLGFRHSIAHGKNQSLSLTRVLEHLELVQEVADFVLDRFEPKP